MSNSFWTPLESNELIKTILFKLNLLLQLHHTLEHEKISITDKEMAGVYDSPNPGQSFLTALGFQIAEQRHLVDADDNIKEIEGAYCATYALWYDPKEEHDSEHRSCNIL